MDLIQSLFRQPEKPVSPFCFRQLLMYDCLRRREIGIEGEKR